MYKQFTCCFAISAVGMIFGLFNNVIFAFCIIGWKSATKFMD